jgi:hypothetical protein
MGKDQRTRGSLWKGQSSIHNKTPYDRPLPATAAKRADLVDGLLLSSDHQLLSNQQPSNQAGARDKESERRSLWKSWVYTPVKALKVRHLQLWTAQAKY